MSQLPGFERPWFQRTKKWLLFIYKYLYKNKTLSKKHFLNYFIRNIVNSNADLTSWTCLKSIRWLLVPQSHLLYKQQIILHLLICSNNFCDRPYIEGDFTFTEGCKLALFVWAYLPQEKGLLRSQTGFNLSVCLNHVILTLSQQSWYFLLQSPYI